MNKIIIRKEKPEDYKKTEHMTLRAFWNIHGPGCSEHYLVHLLRDDPAYIPELSRVAELDGEIVGAIFYSRAKVVDGDREEEVLIFGPLCVEPTKFSLGIGSMLLKETTMLAKNSGYPGIIIFGEPDYYPRHGFVTCDHFGITNEEGQNFDAFMALPLNETFSGIHGKFYEAPIFEECNNTEAVEAFTKQFPYYKPLKLSCQWLHEERLGRISEIQKNKYTIQFFDKDFSARLKGNFYEKEDCDFPVVGDYVTFLLNPIGDSIITSVCERTSFLKRPDQSKTGVDQPMVANVDYLFIVCSLNYDYSVNRIARYISVALNGNATPVVILTKMDLCSNPGRYISEVEELSEGLRVHAVSAACGIGLEELDEYLLPGKSICFMGSSGVGKSTLLNAISGQECMKTSAVRESDSKGRHTTTHRQLFKLENGVTIIDTPGMRELGMSDVSEGIDDTFADIVELGRQCRFSDCRHDTEPGCAIKRALEDGTLSYERYALFQSLHEENKINYAKKKEISKWVKQMKKGGYLFLLCFSAMFLGACGKENSEVVDVYEPAEESNVSENGSFYNTEINRDGVVIQLSTAEEGHPTPDADYQIFYEWSDTEQSSTEVSIEYIVNDGKIEKDYEYSAQINSDNTLKLDDKDFYYVIESDTEMSLLCTVSENLYLQEKLRVLDCFDDGTGDSIPFSGKIEDILQDEKFLNLTHILFLY